MTPANPSNFQTVRMRKGYSRLHPAMTDICIRCAGGNTYGESGPSARGNPDRRIWLFRGRAGPDRAIQTLSNSPVNHVGMTVAIEDLPPLIWTPNSGKS